MSGTDAMSSIPARRSTIALLQSLKPRHTNWDDFLLAAFEDWLPPETVLELERREREETSSPFSQIEKRHRSWGGRRK